MPEKYPRECIEVVAFTQFVPLKLHEILILSSNPLEISNQLVSLRAFNTLGKNNVDGKEFDNELWYKVHFSDAVKARSEHNVKNYAHQVPLAEQSFNERYPYHEIPFCTHGSVWDFYTAVGYDYKNQKFVGIGKL